MKMKIKDTTFIAVFVTLGVLNFLMMLHFLCILFDIPDTKNTNIRIFYGKALHQFYNLQNITILLVIITVIFSIIIHLLLNHREDVDDETFLIAGIVSFIITFIMYLIFILYPTFINKKYVSDVELLEQYYTINKIEKSDKKVTYTEMLKTTKQTIEKINLENEKMVNEINLGRKNSKLYEKFNSDPTNISILNEIKYEKSKLTFLTGENEKIDNFCKEVLNVDYTQCNILKLDSKTSEVKNIILENRDIFKVMDVIY